MHHVLVRYIAIGENNLIDMMRSAKLFKVCLGDNFDSIGIKWSRQRCRIPPTSNAGNLRGGECNDIGRSIATVHHVEVVEVSPCRPGNNNSATLRAAFCWLCHFGVGSIGSGLG
jgi:hypothetical protein